MRRGYPRLQSDVYIFLQRCFIAKSKVGFQASNHLSNNLYVLTVGYIVQCHARIHTVGDLLYWTALLNHNQQFVSWVYLYLITAAAENTLISMGNTFSTCVFFESKTNRTSVQTDCTILVFSK